VLLGSAFVSGVFLPELLSGPSLALKDVSSLLLERVIFTAGGLEVGVQEEGLSVDGTSLLLLYT
jgi:hypothetical protein